MKVSNISLNCKASFLLLLVFFCGTKALFSQQFKEITGRIVNDSLSVSGIHVINKTKGNAEITTADGEFKVVVSPGDLLIFSAVQFKTKMVSIDEQLFDSKALTIYMEPFVNELKEVVVTPYNLSGDLSNDLNNPDIQKPVNFYSLGIPGYGGKREEKIISKKSLILNTLLLPISGGINIEAMYKHFSGYYKNLKKKRQLDVQFENTYQIIQFYGVQFLMDSFSIKQEAVYEFITGVQENYPIDEAFKKKNHAQVFDYLESYAQNFKTETDTVTSSH